MSDPGMSSTITFDAAGFEAIARELAAALGTATKAFQVGLSQVFANTGRKASGANNPFKNMTKGVADSLKIIEARLRGLDQLAARININPATFGLINDNVEQTHHLLKMAATEANAFAVDMNRVRAVSAATKTALGGGFLDLGSLNLQFREMRSIRETDAKLQDRLLRNQAERERSAASARIVAEQGTNARMIASTRAANQRRVELFRAAIQQIRALERGLGAIFRFTARQIESAFRGVGRTIATSISGALARSNAGLTSGTASALGRRESLFRSSFSRQEKTVNDSITRQTRTIQNFERKLSSGVVGAATGRGGGIFGGGLLAGAAGGLGLGALLGSGFERFSQLETLNRQFTVLTGSAENAVAMMQQMKDFAKVTPFDLTGVAGLAKGFLAIGTATEDVLPQVRTIADAVAFTGGGTDSLERIQRAIGQVVSAGRLQGDELNQLAENLPSLNIRKLLAEQLTGGDVAALVELQEAGKITADMFVNGLMTGLSTDPRIAGAAEDMANTLKGRFDNLKESFADLGATIIGVFADEIKVAFRVLNDLFAGISQFIKGEDLSAGMQLLRTAAEGAAIALGGLLVVKLVAEGIGLLGSALGFLLTPFGIFIAAVAGVGAIFKVLYDNSQQLRDALGRTGELIGSIFGAIGDVVSEVFGSVSDFAGGTGANLLTTLGDRLAGVVDKINNAVGPFVTGTLVPALGRFATVLKNDVYPAVVNFLGDAAYFLRGTVFPILRNFYNFLANTLVPFLSERVVNAFKFVKDAITELDFSKLARLGGVVAAALAGFAVGGPIGGLLAGGAAAIGLLFADTLGKSILDGIGNLAGMIGDALEGPLKAAGSAIADFFATDNLLNIAGNVLQFVETVGFTIANILTDPRVVAGVATFIGLAAAAAVRFVEGLIRGIADNLPGLYDLMKEAGGTALEALVDGLTSGDFLAKAIPALIVGASLLGAWRSAGQKAGVAMGQGFLGSFKTNAFGGALAGGGTLTRGGGGGAFIGRALFGAGGIEGAERRVKADATRLTNSMARTLSMAGRNIQQAPGEGFSAAVKRMFDQLVAEIGPSGVQGLRFRNAIKTLFTGNFRQFAADAQISGRTIGRGLAVGVAAGFAGFQIGKSIAQSGGSGLDQLLGIGGAGLAVAAFGGPVGIAAGAATVALGGLGVMMGNTARKAEESEARISGFAEAINSITEESTFAIGKELIKQLEADVGEGALSKALAKGFDVGDFAKQLEAGTASMSATVQELTGKMFDEDNFIGMRHALEDIGFGAGEADDLLKFLSIAVDEYGTSVTVAGNKRELVEQLEDLLPAAENAAGGMSTLQTNILTIHGAITTLFAGANAIKLEEDLRATEEQLRADEKAAQDARDAVTEFLSGDYQNSLQSVIDEFITGLPGVSQSIIDALVIPDEQLRAAVLREIGEGVNVDLRARFQAELIQDPTQTEESIVAKVEAEIQAALEGKTITPEVAATLRLALTEFAADTDFGALIQALVDQKLIPPTVNFPINPNIILAPGENPNLIPGVLGFANPGAAASTTTFDVPITVNPIVTVNQTTIATVGGQVANAIAQGILGAGLIISIAAIAVVNSGIAATALAKPGAVAAGVAIGAALAAGIQTGASTAATAIGSALSSGASGASGASTGIGGQIAIGIARGILGAGAVITAATVATINAALAAARVSVGAAAAIGGQVANAIARGILAAGTIVSIAAIAVVRSAVSAASGAAAGAAAVGQSLSANFARGISAGGGSAVSAARSVGALASRSITASTDQAYQSGINLGNALARGIRDSGQQAIGAARAVANAITAATRSALRISSPSRVFYDIGIEAGRGFAEGMRDSEGSMVSAASEAVNAAMEAAATAAGQPRGNLIAGLFEASQVGTGRAGAASISAGIAQLAGIGQRFQDAVHETAVAIWNATVAGGEGSASEQALIGTSWQSLNVFDPAGSRNVGAFLEMGEQIRSFVVEQLNAGRDAGEVFYYARAYRDELVGAALAKGLDPGLINTYIDQLGLSEAALNAFWQEVLNATSEAERHAVVLQQLADAEKAAELEEQAKRDREEAAKESEEKEIERLKELIRLAGINTRPIEVNVTPPFGDPEAIGLGVANRVAFSLAG